MKKIFLVALVIRLICLYLFRNVSNYDSQSYLQVGELTLNGINIYPSFANLHHPYLPFFLYIEAMAFYLGRRGVIIIKLINTIFDLGILYLVYLLSKKNFKKTLLYAINPVTILITTLHGQFDVIPVFFILLSIYLFIVINEVKAILSFSIAVLTKTWPVLFLIPISRRVKNKKLVTLIFLFPIVSVLIYYYFFKSSFIDIGKTLVNYQGLWGIWGITLVGKGLLSVFWQRISTLLFLVGFFIYSWLNKERNMIINIYKLLLFFFVFTTNFSIQYFTWLMPFLILVKPKKTLHLIILMTFYLFSFYYLWLFCLACKSTPNWLIILQNTIGLALWLSFIKIGYLSRKIS